MLATHTARSGVHNLLFAASLALGSACGAELDAPADVEFGDRDDALSGDVATKTVNPDQPATLALKTGATLNIPRGAVRRPTRIRFERPRARVARELISDLEASGQFEAVSAPHILTPHGTTLLKDASVSLPIAPGARDSHLVVLWLEDENDRNWKLLDTAERRGNRATFPIRHFSVVIVATGNASPPVDGGASDGGASDAQLPVDATFPDTGDEDASVSSCGNGASQPGVLFARVVDATTPSMPIPGVTVIVLDDVTGLPVVPSIQAVSLSDGCVQLSIGSLSSFGIKALGNDNYTDTYTFHYRPDSVEPAIRMGGNNVAVLVPALAGFEPRADRAPVVGAVNWKTSDMQFYDVIGCARIEAETGDLTTQDLRYFAATLPSSLVEWPLANGTNPQNGRFYIGNMLPGPHTLTARLPDGTVIGSSTLVVFPRSAASTLVNGVGQNLFFGGIFIDAPAGATKPGCPTTP